MVMQSSACVFSAFSEEQLKVSKLCNGQDTQCNECKIYGFLTSAELQGCVMNFTVTK